MAEGTFQDVAASTPDDLTLARARRGDLAAQGDLVRAHQGPVYALVGRMLVGCEAEIDDVAQEAFVKILRALPRFDPGGPATLRTWMLTIATRASLDALRRKRHFEGPGHLRQIEGTGPSQEELASGRELARRLEQTIARLPDDHRAVLLLRAYHDFDYPEIAQALSISEGTVKSRLSRARGELRRILDQERDPR